MSIQLIIQIQKSIVDSLLLGLGLIIDHSKDLKKIYEKKI